MTFGDHCIAAIATERQRRTANKLAPIMRSEAAKIIDDLFAAQLPSAPTAKTKGTNSATLATDGDWLKSIASDPALDGLDIPRELTKAQFWARTNNRVCTRRFFLKWLAKADRTMEKGGDASPNTTQASLGSLQMQLGRIEGEMSDILYPGGSAWKTIPTGEKLERFTDLKTQRDAIKTRIGNIDHVTA